MSRRSTPARLEEARRAGFRNRLIGSGMLPDRADAAMAAWEAEAALRGLSERTGGYWDSAWDWIEARRHR